MDPTLSLSVHDMVVAIVALKTGGPIFTENPIVSVTLFVDV